MDIRDNLELIEVNYTPDRKKVTLVFLDDERGEIREVNFNKQSFRDGKYIDDPEKEQKVAGWCNEFFGTEFDNLGTAIGAKKKVYCYDTFSSLFESAQVKKFSEDMLGKLYQTTIKEIILEDVFIKIRYDINNETYESKQTFGKYMESMHRWMLDPVKKSKELEKFKTKYGVPIDERDTLIGKKLIVEVKKAFSSYYGDVKPMPV